VSRLLVALVALGGCATPPVTPRETVERYIEAVRDGDEEAARELIDGDLPPGSLAALREAMPQDESLPTGEPSYEWHWRTPAGPVVVRSGPDGPVIASGVLGFFEQRTPEAAALAFIHAIETRRSDVLATLMPSRLGPEPEEMATRVLESDEVERLRESGFLAALRVALERPAQRLSEDRAQLEAEGRVLVLVREPSGWKIEDIR
jgi:hypothetical protein